MTPSLHLIGKEPHLMELTGKAYNPPLAASPKANNPIFLCTPTTGLQHYTSKPPKITVSTNAVSVGRSDMNEGRMLKESHMYEKHPT
jgi:hypothetical protein